MFLKIMNLSHPVPEKNSQNDELLCRRAGGFRASFESDTFSLWRLKSLTNIILLKNVKSRIQQGKNQLQNRY